MQEQQLFKNILLPVAGSDESIAAAQFAIKCAALHDSQIIALHVVDTTVIRQMARFSNKTPGEIEVDMEENGWRYLFHIEEMAKDNKVKIIVMLERGLPYEEILNKARELKADLIIIGQASERGTAGRMLDRNL